jgi:poly(A) polymerase
VRFQNAGVGSTAPTIVPRPEHVISRANVSECALKVLYRLKNAGYQAYLVGGGVRDLLLGHEPKDFDVATDARPEEIRKLFRNCRLIGRRFRLAHVCFGHQIVEVATFRALHDPEKLDAGASELRIEGGRIVRDNIYGSIEEDAWRRDFTVNALYYNISNFTVADYVGGLNDLQSGVLRMIGDPVQRYREDPVRMLRAVRFAAKLGFRFHPRTNAPLHELGHLLKDISPSRLFDETLKLFLGGCALQTFELLRHYNLFGYLFPLTEGSLARDQDGFSSIFLAKALANTDARSAEDKAVTPAFLFAVLLWEPTRLLVEKELRAGLSPGDALRTAAAEVLARQVKHTAIPKRLSMPMREIWALQPRLADRCAKRVSRLLAHPRFRAGYDFMMLRAEAGEVSQDLAEWWTALQEDHSQNRSNVSSGRGKRRHRARRRRKQPAGDGRAEQ